VKRKIYAGKKSCEIHEIGRAPRIFFPCETIANEVRKNTCCGLSANDPSSLKIAHDPCQCYVELGFPPFPETEWICLDGLTWIS
jgi:hypothetical protein